MTDMTKKIPPSLFAGLAAGARVSLGGRFIAPKGPPKPVGKPRGRPGALGRLEWDAPLNQAMIIVGRNKGKKPRNQAGSCATAPTQFSSAAVDRWFQTLRAAQVGQKSVAGTKVDGEGWYKGDPEPSVTYQVIHDPFVPGEKTLPQFQKRMQRLAEDLSDVLCQDEVLVVMDTDKGKHTYSYSARGRRRR